MKKMKRDNEPWSSLTHSAGAVLSVAGLVLMVVFGALYGRAPHVVGFSIFGTSLILLYSASAVYHFLPKQTRSKEILKRLDHAMIYLLIAGTYTPICLAIPFRGWGWSLFGVIWGLATIGFILKISGVMFERISLALYILMGWLITIAIIPLRQWLGFEAMLWLVLGGVFYTVGSIFFALSETRQSKYSFGYHEVWHLFVMLGSFSHFWLMFAHISKI